MKISIVGLGLMGGSMAMALRGFKNAHIIGIETKKETLSEALESKAVDEGYILSDLTAQKALGDCDVCIICIYPKATQEFLKTFGRYFKEGAIVSDICGIKTKIIESAEKTLSKNVFFVGGHPMAGKEISGFEAATKTLFNGCNYIFTPTQNTNHQALELLSQIALYVGASKVTISKPKDHDAFIAYTSQLAHVIAACTMQNPIATEVKGFEGGSFRDLTRVATLNEKLWSELFILNNDALVQTIDQFVEDIIVFKNAIKNEDELALKRIMIHSTEKKQVFKN